MSEKLLGHTNVLAYSQQMRDGPIRLRNGQRLIFSFPHALRNMEEREGAFPHPYS